MQVLFVDDDQDDFELFCEALKSVNTTARCSHASDGQEALDLLNNPSTALPDYILLDVNMPKMGGKECLVNLKRIPRIKNIPVIVYSTTSAPAEIQTFKQLGADKFIVKPGRFNELVNILKKVLL